MTRYLLLLLLFPSMTLAQDIDSLSNPNRVFQLGEVVVLGSPIDSLNAINNPGFSDPHIKSLKP